MNTLLKREQIEEILEKEKEFRKTSKEVEVKDAFLDKDINDYLKNNSNPNSRPFECPYLVVVPEDLTFVSKVGGSVSVTHDYKNGELVCTTDGGYSFCGFDKKQPFKPDEEGNMHLECINRNYDLETKIMGIKIEK